uniref:Uncharacterized protein n=1 Tax=Bradyrhizobium elkanii TaxID=29448 RepID=C4PL86_BRAEL|nr:hypothetical protein [Bradyrhizobium elkanii]
MTKLAVIRRNHRPRLARTPAGLQASNCSSPQHSQSLGGKSLDGYHPILLPDLRTSSRTSQ